MSNNETQVSNALLDGLDAVINELDLAMAGKPGENWWRDCGLIKARLQALRSTPVEVGVDGAMKLVHTWGDVLDRWQVEAIMSFAHPLPNPSPSDGEVIPREGVMQVYEVLNSGVPYSARECRVSYALHQLLFPTSIFQSSKRGQP